MISFSTKVMIGSSSSLIFCSGDDGLDFITVEHCGDDFLAALAESMQDTEEWDDIQAMETEACGVLNNMFDKDILNGNEPDDDRGKINMVEDSPERQKYPNFLLLDSSDSEEVDLTTPMTKDAGSKPSSFPVWSSSVPPQNSGKRSSRSVVSRTSFFTALPLLFVEFITSCATGCNFL